MITCIKTFIKNEEGVTAVEYSVLAVLIISAIVLAMATFSTGLTAAFAAISTKLITPSA
ncbi:Flp family type IVb pilin [Glacieibacterium sp.]|uniref:Flp family type IVb pilin n=1 Tax=Glacieibacterium sp. TaxID=2860237 RepID=UPI003B002A48